MNLKHITKILTPINILFILWTCVIWGHSMMPADISSDESSMFLIIFNKIIAFTGITASEFAIRKAGHFTEYLILGILLFFFLRTKLQIGQSKAQLRITSLFTGLLIAMIDETIQSFTPGRSCEVRDVWIDFSGVVTGAICIAFLILKIINWKKTKS